MRRNLFFKFSLVALSLYPWSFNGLLGEEGELAATVGFEPKGEKENASADGYKINFSNVSIIEYIRFVSKITGMNFVFDETELQFNVTIVSEEPITTKNIMAALIQVLRIHGLTLIEQENNLLITKNLAVTQIPTILSAEVKKEDFARAPLVTRVFRLKNANPTMIAGLIKPMVSSTALIEAFEPTRQLIVTDIITNVDKIGQLLMSLDTPHSPLEIETYTAKHVVPAQLVSLATKIVSPFADTNPLLFVPQPETNTIFIISTPHLIERTMSVLEDLDKAVSSSKHALSTGSDFLMYQPKYRTGKEMVSGVEEIGKKLQDSGLADPALLRSIHTMKWVPQTSSLLFTGDAETLKRIQEILTEADVPPGSTIGGKSNFFIYKPTYQSVEFLQKSLTGIAKDLKESGLMDPDLLQTLNTMRAIPATDSLLLTGTPDSLKKAEALIATIDTTNPGGSIGHSTAKPSGAAGGLNYILYTPKYVTGPNLIEVMRDFEKTLIDAKVSDRGLFDSINNLKWMDQTSSLIVTGEPETIKKMESLLLKFDIPSAGKGSGSPSIESIENTSFLVYKLQYHQGTEILTAIKQVAAELSKATSTSTQNLVDAINSLQWISVTNSLIATGEQDILTRLQDLIQSLDVPLKQVFIEVLIIQTSLANLQSYGLQWGGFAKYMNKVGVGYGNFPGQNPFTPGVPPSTALQPGLRAVNATSFPNPNTQIPFSQGFDLGSIGDIIMHKGRSFISLGALVNALQTDADSTVLLNPKIITQDTNNSTIFVGQNIPYTGSTLTITGAAGQQSTNIEYRDIGMNLSITPYLGNGDIVTLEISNDISQQIQAAPGQTIAQGGILTTHASLNTRVHVPDQHFVVLSGMISDTKQHFKSGIPCLGGLPVIGVVFSQNDRVASKNNIIIFIRPQIIHTFNNYKDVTDHQEDLYKDNAVLPLLKEEFDEGLNLVKQPEDE